MEQIMGNVIRLTTFRWAVFQERFLSENFVKAKLQSYLGIMFIFLTITATSRANNRMIYWSNFAYPLTIIKATLDGSSSETIINDFQGRGIAIDSENGYLFRTGIYQYSLGQIFRSNLDGSCTTELIKVPGYSFEDIVYDGIKYLYIAAPNRFTHIGAIFRLNVETCTVTTLAELEGKHVHGIDLDLVNQKIYWTEFSPHGSVYMANLDGSDVVELVSNISSLNHVAVDPAGGYIYWSQGDPYNINTIMRADLDGQNASPLITFDERTAYIKKILLDTEDGKMYIANGIHGEGGGVFSVNLDGTDLKMVVSDQYGEVWGLALGPDEGQELMPGDLNGDCKVNLEDFAFLSLNWLQIDCGIENAHCGEADMIPDGLVNIDDLNYFFLSYGQ